MSKDRQIQLAKVVREAAKVQLDPTAKAAIELVKLTLDMAKESLVGAEGDDMLRVQGAARTLNKLYLELTNDPPQMRRQENT